MESDTKNQDSSLFLNQIVPLALTVIIFFFLALLVYLESLIANQFTTTDIIMQVKLTDVLIGLTIYLKTSVDFAIFMGNIMAVYRGWKGRVALELGTAAGNAAGTIIVLAIWNAFREVPILLAAMIALSALVLFELASDGLEHARAVKTPPWFAQMVEGFERLLNAVNRLTKPLLGRLLPNLSLKPPRNLSFSGLFWFSFSIPFILGLDDFAGYVPLFNIVNVLGFAIGVLLGHMILNILLFLSPAKTIRAVKNPYVAFVGSVAFVALGLWGLREAFILLTGH